MIHGSFDLHATHAGYSICKVRIYTRPKETHAELGEHAEEPLKPTVIITTIIIVLYSSNKLPLCHIRMTLNISSVKIQ